jgi:cell division protein ZapA
LSQSNGNGGSTSIRVDIYDQSYHLRGTDPQYIADLAEYVDTKMRLISQQASTVESLKVAVLAALNIADELHVLKRKYDSLTQDYTARAADLSGALDEVLEEGRRVG